MEKKTYDVKKVGLESIDTSDPSLQYIDSDIAFFEEPQQMDDMAALRLNVNVLLMCLEGSASMELNGREITVERRQLLFCHSNALLSNKTISPDFRCSVLCITDRLLRALLRTKMGIWNRMMYINKTNVIPLTEENIANIKSYYDLVKCKMKQHENPYKREVICSLLRTILIDLCALIVMRNKLDEKVELSQGKLLFGRFLQTLAESNVKRHTVEHYASLLYVTPKYLSMVCKRESGKTALEWIQEYVSEDIRYYLTGSELSVKEIANRLGFPNISFFGKYVRERFGVSPKKLRQLVATGKTNDMNMGHGGQ